jgi:hypothetical protein
MSRCLFGGPFGTQRLPNNVEHINDTPLICESQQQQQKIKREHNNTKYVAPILNFQ